MNEEHREWLGRIEELLEKFAEDQTYERLRVVNDELRKLYRAVAATGYSGIELTILGFLLHDVRYGLLGLLDAHAQPAVVAADCQRLRNSISRLLYPSGVAQKVMSRSGTAAAPQDQSGAQPQVPAKAAAPVVTLAKITYCIGDGRFWEVNSPDSTIKLTSPVQAMISLRDLGLKKVRWLRMELLSAEETLWVCDVMRKVYDDHSHTTDLIINIEILGPAGQRLHVRLTVTKNRSKVMLSYETRALVRAQGQGKSLEQVKAELIGEFSLASIEETAGSAWTVDNLLEIQAAFLKIPIPDRGALRNLILRRRKFAPDKDSDAGREMGCYTAAEHCLSLLDLAFAEPKGYTGSGADAYPHCHWVILHEVGHVVEEWFKPPRVASTRQDRARRIVDELNAQRDELLILRERFKEGPDYEEADRALRVVRERLRTADKELTDAFQEMHGQEDCLGIFVGYVNSIGVQAFTLYSWENWPHKPYEFFAEAYTCFLNDPAAMEIVSPPLLNWFRHGRYRVGRPEVLLLRQPGLTADQLTALSGAQGLLDQLCFDLAKATAASEKIVVALRESYAKLVAAIDELINHARGNENASIEVLVLAWIRDTLAQGVGVPLGAGGSPLPQFAVFPALKLVCEGERAVLAALLKPAPAGFAGLAKGIRRRTCTIQLSANAPGKVLIGTENQTDFEIVGPSKALVLLRERGFRRLSRINCKNLGATQMTWLWNVARKVHVDCGSRLGLNVSVVMVVPSEQKIYYVHLVFAESGTLIISLDGIKTAGEAPALLPPRAEVEKRLRTEFGVAKISGGDGADWQVSELVQICDAFALVPTEDLPVLSGCNLLRRPAARTGAVGAIELGDCGAYFPDTHTLVLFDSAFTDPDRTFVGLGQRRPGSRRTILHLVGHVIGLRPPDWLVQLKLPEIGAPSPDALPYVIAKFRSMVTEFELKPITPESEAVWETQPLEFFADAYALCLTEPDILDWVSSVLREWIQNGGYRSI